MFLDLLKFSTDNIVAMDVEYGGGRTVPRVAIVDFNEQCLYFSDFCLRYEDWIDTKVTEEADDQARKSSYKDHMSYLQRQSKENSRVDITTAKEDPDT